MNKGRKIASVLVLFLAAAGLTASVASAAFDSWSGRAETFVTKTQSVTSGDATVVDAAVSGVSLNVRSLVLTSSVSAVVTLYDGATESTHNIASFGLIANTPLILNEDVLGQGIRTTAGNGLYVDTSSSGVVTFSGRIRKDP